MMTETCRGVIVIVAAALAACGGVFADETRVVFDETETAYISVELSSVSTYEYEYTYNVYFKGSANTAIVLTGNDPQGNPTSARKPVAEIKGLDAQRVKLVACVSDNCIDLDRGTDGDYDVVKRDHNIEIQIKRPTDGARKGDIRRNIASGSAAFRLVAERGMASYARETDGPTEPSDAIDMDLPALGQTESQFLGGIPSLRFKLAPLVQDHNPADENGAALAFEGGVYRFRRSHRLGASYSGDVSTRDELSFSNIKLDLDYERNLSKRGYIPLSVTAGGESDQHFDVINGLVGVAVQYILPFNINNSPRDAYIPNTGPLFEIKGELGWNVHDQDTPGLTAPDDFQRAGYALRWMVPVARNTVMRLHHAGTWVLLDDRDGTDEFRQLWEVTLETKIANLTYFVGYQQGEAAPLYVPIETTRTGVVYKFE